MDTDTTPPLKTMNRRDVLSYFEHSKQHDTPTKMALQWVRCFQDLLDTVAVQGRNAPWPYFSQFWVILSDIMLALREWSEEQSKFGDDKVQPGTGYYRAVMSHKALVVAIDALKAQLTRDELIYADLMRQTCCHVFQRGFMIQLKRKGMPVGFVGLKEERAVPTLADEVLHLDAIMEAVDRVLAPHRGVDGDIVHGLAVRLRPYVPALVAPLHQMVNDRSSPAEDAAYLRMIEGVMARAVP